MADLNVKIQGAAQLRRLLKLIPQSSFETAKEAFKVATLSAHREIAKYPGGLHNRSGRLRRSIKTARSGSNLATLTGEVFTDMIYAPIQERGGTITAKRAYTGVPGGPYLNIPLPDNLTKKGVLRQPAQQVFAGGGYIIKSKIGNYLVVSGAGQLMFVLKKQVEIPARLEMVQTTEDQIPTLLNKLNNELLNDLPR